MVKVEVKGNLKEVFEEALGESSRDRDVSALVPLASAMVLSVNPFGKGYWSFHDFSAYSSLYPLNSTTTPNIGPKSGPEEIRQKLSTLSLPFLLAVRTKYLGKCLHSLYSSRGFPGVLFRILRERCKKDLGLFGIREEGPDNPDGPNSSEWSIFLDQTPREIDLYYAPRLYHDLPTSTSYPSTLSSSPNRLTQTDLLVAERELSKRRDDILLHIGGAEKTIMSFFSFPDISIPEVGYFPGVISFMAERAPRVLAVSDFHPFLFNSLGAVKKKYQDESEERRKNTLFLGPSRRRDFLKIAYLEFSESLETNDPVSIKVMEGRDGGETEKNVLHYIRERELEEVWSIKLGKDSPIRAEGVQVLGLVSSNTFYWSSLMETMGKLYKLPTPKEKVLVVEEGPEEKDQWPDWSVPGLKGLSREELRGIVHGYETKGMRLSNTQPIYFSPTLIFDYPNNLGNIHAIYLVPLAFSEDDNRSFHFCFLPVVAFSGRLGISTVFSGNEVLGFDFLLTHSYPVPKEKDPTPYISISSVIKVDIEEPRVNGKNLSSRLNESGIKLVRSEERLWSGLTLYLHKGLRPIPGVRFSTVYLPLLLEGHGREGEMLDIGNLKRLSEALAMHVLKQDSHKDASSSEFISAPVQEALFPDLAKGEVYFSHIPLYRGREGEFRKRVSDFISLSSLLVEKKMESRNTCIRAYVLREDIRQEANSFPVPLFKERIDKLASHPYFSLLREILYPAAPRKELGVGPVDRHSPILEEIYGYTSFLPEEAREEVRKYLLFLYQLMEAPGSGSGLEEVLPPPEEGFSLFALVSEPAFHIRAYPVENLYAPEESGEPLSLKTSFTIDAYPNWALGYRGTAGAWEKEKYLPPVPLVRFLRINYDRDDRVGGGSGFFMTLHIFHYGELQADEEGYPLNTILPLTL